MKVPKIDALNWEDYDDELDNFEKIRKQKMGDEVERNDRDARATIKNGRRTKILLQELTDD